MIRIRNRVKELRARHGWTQTQLGSRVCVTRQTVAAIEKGDYVPSLLLGLQICAAFGLPAEEVFQLENDAKGVKK